MDNQNYIFTKGDILQINNVVCRNERFIYLIRHHFDY